MPAYLKAIAPAAETYHLITQNVDRLSTAALNSLGKTLANKEGRANRVKMDSVVEMHGRLFDIKCTVCDYCAEDLSNPLCPPLGAADIQLEGYKDAGTKSIDIPESDLPRCPSCNSLARPGVVWFDEKPHHLDEINSLIFKADLCIVVGTSLTVQSRLSLPILAQLKFYPHRCDQHRRMCIAFNATTEKLLYLI